MSDPARPVGRAGRAGRVADVRVHAHVADEDLLAAYVDAPGSTGGQAAFDVLVQRHAARVYAVCRARLRDARDAEDATQETFVAVLRSAGTFRGGAAFTTWLHRVAVNACTDLLRRRARRPWTDGPDVADRMDAGVLADPSAVDALTARELSLDLAQALRVLDASTRAAVVLHDVVGLPYAEVAARLALPIGTVKSRIHRAHARLADALTRTPPPGSGGAGAHTARVHTADTHTADTHTADTHTADTHTADTHTADTHTADRTDVRPTGVARRQHDRHREPDGPLGPPTG